MDKRLEKLPSENEAEYIFRIGQDKDNGFLGEYTWGDISPILNEQLGYDEEDWKGESAWRKRYRNYLDAYEQIFSKNGFAKGYQDSLETKQRDLQKERIKFQTEKLEYNKWLREESRDELIAEKIVNAIKELDPIDIPDPIVLNSNDFFDNKSAVLCFGDEHYGTEFKIYGLYGEILNEYSPEIFEKRMNDLLSKVVEIVRKDGITTLNVYSLGDEVDGILRVSQLKKLRYGVVESSVRYAEYISSWLNKLSKYVNIKYQMTFGNHSELRMLGQPKGTFKDDNTGLFVKEIIKTRLANNPNFEMIENPTGLIFDNVQGYNVLGIHGEVKNMEKAIKDFSSTYGVDINILVGGHKHHYAAENVGFDMDVINVPSIIGVDEYSMSLNKTSRPGATMFIVDKQSGITTEHKIKL